MAIPKAVPCCQGSKKIFTVMVYSDPASANLGPAIDHYIVVYSAIVP